MDRLALDVVSIRHGRHANRTIGIRINDRRLQDLVRDVELTHAKAENARKLAGGYALLRFPTSTLTGDISSVVQSRAGSRTVTPPCWAVLVANGLLATDRADRAQQRHRELGGFRNGHRDWDLSALGPFTFDREQ